VSQHGADSHAWDPLAHLRVTTTAMGEAARLVDGVAHRWADGRWLATGGGGYDAYRVVPRAWALTWLAGAHREVPAATPAAWRERWAGEAARYGQAPLPSTFDDPELDAELTVRDEADDVALAVGALVRRVVVPRLVRDGVDRGWYDPLAAVDVVAGGADAVDVLQHNGDPTILAGLDRAAWANLTLAPRVVAPADPVAAHALLDACLADGASLTVAVQDRTVVGALVVLDGDLLALGVAPDWRGRGLATALLAAGPSVDRAEITLAERDVVEPLPVSTRMDIARRLLTRAGLQVDRADGAITRVDPRAISGTRR